MNYLCDLCVSAVNILGGLRWNLAGSEPMTPAEEIANFTELPVEIQTELDCKIMTVRELLELEVGDVMWLTRSAGENLDILIGGTLVGYGETVIIESTMGVRITDFNSEV
jgi:flagellar motor switch protein FliN/FliY